MLWSRFYIFFDLVLEHGLPKNDSCGLLCRYLPSLLTHARPTPTSPGGRRGSIPLPSTATQSARTVRKSKKAKLPRPSASPRQIITSPGQQTPKEGDVFFARFRNRTIADVLASTPDRVADQKKLATTPAQKRTSTKKSPATAQKKPKQQPNTARKMKSDKQKVTGKMTPWGGNRQKAVGNNYLFWDADIQIELQAFRLLLPLRTTDRNPYDQDGTVKDHFFRPM